MRRRPRAACSLLAAAAAAAAAACAFGQVLPNLTGPAPEEPEDDDLWTRIRGFEDVPASAPHPGVFTAAFKARGDAASRALLDVVEHLEDVVAESNCLLRDHEWGDNVEGFVKLRGWKSPSLGCKSSTIGVRTNALRFSADEVYQRMKRYWEMIESLKNVIYGQTLGKLPNETQFESVVATRNFDYEQGRFQTCEVERITALRVVSEDTKEPIWYLMQGLTNQPLSRTMPDRGRKYIGESVGVSLKERKQVDPLWQSLKPVGKGNENKTRSNFFTTLEEWSGRVGMSAMYAMDIGDAPALKQALEVTDLDVDQAKDALTPSNIAILSLPMAMNLIPISCLAEVSTMGVLVTTLLTDVLTTVPFIVKGYELVAMGNRRTVRQEAFYTDGREGSDFLILELWAAECRLKDVKTVGWLFIAVGFIVLIAGVVCEFVAARVRRTWTKDGAVVIPPKRKMLKAFLGRDFRASDDDVNEPFFDPEDETAAFQAQQ